MANVRGVRIRNVKFDGDRQKVTIYTTMGRIIVDVDALTGLSVDVTVRPHKRNKFCLKYPWSAEDQKGREIHYTLIRRPITHRERTS